MITATKLSEILHQHFGAAFGFMVRDLAYIGLRANVCKNQFLFATIIKVSPRKLVWTYVIENFALILTVQSVSRYDLPVARKLASKFGTFSKNVNFDTVSSK